MASTELNSGVIAVIKRALATGYMQHVIAAYYLLNQGRVSEINRGKRGVGVEPADQLPADFPALN